MKIMMKLSDEQLLQTFLLLCYPQPPAETLAAKLADGINEERLKWLINRHRVWNLVAVAISKLDTQFFSTDFRLWLQGASARRQQQTLLQFKVQSELSKELNEVGVKHRFFKGIDLSLRLYGDLNGRYSRDIDLLVSEHNAVSAERILIDYGYTPLNDAFTDTAPGHVIRGSFHKDKSYQASGLSVIELHIRVNSENTAFSKAVTEALLAGGQHLNVLEYLYLCVHAMKSHCHRIKWLIDLACYYERLNQQMPNWHEQKWQDAKKFGVVRQVIACEYLMAQYLGIAVEPKSFIGLKNYCDWVRSTWLDEYISLFSLKRMVLPMLMNDQFEHRLKAIYFLLFCPNDADVAFINRYASGDGRLLSLLLPFRKLFLYIKRKLLGPSYNR
ncbi:nucleotidyltransferase family protein [Shewanella sp. FJAT-51649]|uniref:nucleotidyltransferase family protein n=1 Tax=Shewanella sp. FJAT-51649 TaxID=2864210 RepID=UPI001C659C15|nr:nucleotidyltransferase family protein [Shewanella sp. FJAT-51649]QYJ72806.1 nucleotidyltransferase family protein [Shewanella sp. FJAT-51649]